MISVRLTMSALTAKYVAWLPAVARSAWTQCKPHAVRQWLLDQMLCMGEIIRIQAWKILFHLQRPFIHVFHTNFILPYM
jgi:hypothetical protein